MAVDPQYARFLVSCRQAGVRFQQTVTLGRLNYYLSLKETRRLLNRAGMRVSPDSPLLNYEASRYAEPLFKALGAECVESMDASGFEGATIVHDLNQPVPEALRQRFDVVCDAGTIEHVFNFPTVIRNCMEMVRVGGHLTLASPANNFFGHGFYQFSPELWFRLLSPAQGFEVRRMVAVQYSPFVRWWEVADPASVRERVTLANRYPILLMILARKTATGPEPAPIPQQSDYVPRWQGEGDPASRRSALEVRFRRTFLETFPRLARFLENFALYGWWGRSASFRNRRHFKRVNR